MSCFKIVEETLGGGPRLGYRIEVHHELEEGEVPLYEAWFNEEKKVSEEQAIAIMGEQEVKQYIKLKVCKNCGMVFLPKEE